jgi:hypothetical protein
MGIVSELLNPLQPLGHRQPQAAFAILTHLILRTPDADGAAVHTKSISGIHAAMMIALAIRAISFSVSTTSPISSHSAPHIHIEELRIA